MSGIAKRPAHGRLVLDNGCLHQLHAFTSMNETKETMNAAPMDPTPALASRVVALSLRLILHLYLLFAAAEPDPVF